MVDLFLDSLRSEWESLLMRAPQILAALAVIVLAVVVGKVLAAAVGRVLLRARLSRLHRDVMRRVVFWSVVFFGLATSLNVLGLEAAATGLLAGGGITAVILGFAFRQIGENFLAGLLLAFSRPFRVNDLIQSGDFKGTVRAIELRYTHIRSSDGRDIYIPNARIFNDPLVNYTRDGLLRPSFTVGIDYADDATAACALARETVARVEGVCTEPPPTTHIKSLEPSFVLLEIAFWVDTLASNVTLVAVRSAAIDSCRQQLLEAGYTLSSEVSTNVAVSTPEPAAIRLRSDGEPPSGS